MIQEGDDLTWMWVVVMNVAGVVKFRTYMRVYLTEFVDGLDVKCERVIDDSKIFGLGH